MKLIHSFLLTATLLLFSNNMFSQGVVVADIDKQLFDKYAEQIAPYQSEAIETILEQTALFFLGTPYIASTLDKDIEEDLVVNLHELDCFTFVENVLALSATAKSNNLSMDSFKEKLKAIRYRDGSIIDYASRLHYTSDWLYENQKNGLLENISQQLGGVKETKQINFMSTHQGAYKQLATDDAMLNKIFAVEQFIKSRGGFFYLPKELIATKADLIPHLSVVGFVTAIDGLDTTHVGFAFKKKSGELTFIHASSAKMEVVIDRMSLSNYCVSQKNCMGIIVAQVL